MKNKCIVNIENYNFFISINSTKLRKIECSYPYFFFPFTITRN